MDFKTPERKLMTVMVVRPNRQLEYVSKNDGKTKQSTVVTVIQVHPVTLSFLNYDMLEIYVSPSIAKQIRKDAVYDVSVEVNIAGVTGNINKDTGFGAFHEKDGLNSNLWTPIGGATLKGANDVKPMADVIASEIEKQIAEEEANAKAAELIMQQ